MAIKLLHSISSRGTNFKKRSAILFGLFLVATMTVVSPTIATAATPAGSGDCLFSRGASAPSYNSGYVLIGLRGYTDPLALYPGDITYKTNGFYKVYVPAGKDVEVKQANSSHLPYGPIIYNFTSTGWHSMPCKVGLSSEFSYWQHKQ